jgi:hypothetical protein
MAGFIISYGSTKIGAFDVPEPSDSERAAFEPLRKLLVADAEAKRERAKARTMARERARKLKLESRMLDMGEPLPFE